MPTRITYHAIIPSIPDFDRILNPVRGAMFDVVEPEIERRLRKKWKGDIDFNKTRTDDTKQISTLVEPAGDNRQKWVWVTLGTPAHKIPKTPKPPGTSLKFKWGGPGSHKPKTVPYRSPFRLGSGAGHETVFFSQVNHPGIEPRYIEKQVKDEYRPTFVKYMKTVFYASVRTEMRRQKSTIS